MAEQRKHHRVPVNVGVTCIQRDGATFDGSVRDISVGGMFVRYPEEEIPFGTELTLVLRDVAPRELRLPAVVRWSDQHGFGVQFGVIGAYATHALVDLVKRYQ